MDEVIVLHKLLGDGSLTSSGGSHDNAVQVPPRSPTKVPHTYSSRRNHPVLTGATSSQNNNYSYSRFTQLFVINFLCK